MHFTMATDDGDKRIATGKRRPDTDDDGDAVEKVYVCAFVRLL